MHTYGLIKKILHNHKDNHPPKGWVNWWESRHNKKINKKSERQRVKKNIEKELL